MAASEYQVTGMTCPSSATRARVQRWGPLLAVYSAGGTGSEPTLEEKGR